jgi:hypothetical protein
MQRLANEMGKAQVSRSPEFLGRMIMRQESAGVGVNTTFKPTKKTLNVWGGLSNISARGQKKVRKFR